MKSVMFDAKPFSSSGGGGTSLTRVYRIYMHHQCPVLVYYFVGYSAMVSPSSLNVAAEDNRFVLECSHNHPSLLFARYTWQRRDGQALPTGRYEIDGRGGSRLTIRNPVESDAGEYVCSVGDGVQSAQSASGIVTYGELMSLPCLV